MMKGVGTYLDAILKYHRDRAAGDNRDLLTLTAQAEDCAPARGFRTALQAGDRLNIIAEIKRRSPSKGELCPDLDPLRLAQEYEAGGASCLSVLTEELHFAGSPEDLVVARAATGIPVLRKDFTVDLRDICDTRIMGADCVLIIVAALEDAELSEFCAFASELGLDALVEVHNQVEVERALAVGATLIGVNQRDLFSFSVDRQRAAQLAVSLPKGVCKVAESGVRDRLDAEALALAGYEAVLVGESLVLSSDPRAMVSELAVSRSASNSN